MDISTIAVSATTLPSLNPESAPTASPLSLDVVSDRFNAMMLNGATSPTSATTFHDGSHPVSLSSLKEPQSLGAQILSGLHSASVNYAQKWKSVTEGLDGMSAHPSASSMLRVQSELLQVSLQYELVGKAISRSTQNIDTLVRMS